MSPARPEEALERAGHMLPAEHPVVANYAKTVRVGPLLFVAGHGPFVNGRPAHTGKLGAELGVSAGRKAAEVVMLNILGTLRSELGELSRVERFVKVVVFVNASADFTEHHLVADGATDLLVQVFGDRGRPARSAIGMASLPFNFAVEIEAVVEVSS